jgi:hypothetical protein
MSDLVRQWESIETVASSDDPSIPNLRLNGCAEAQLAILMLDDQSAEVPQCGLETGGFEDLAERLDAIAKPIRQDPALVGSAHRPKRQPVFLVDL